MVIFPASADFHSSGTAARMSTSLGSCLSPAFFASFDRSAFRDTSGGGFLVELSDCCWALCTAINSFTIAVQHKR